MGPVSIAKSYCHLGIVIRRNGREVKVMEWPILNKNCDDRTGYRLPQTMQMPTLFCGSK